MASIEQCEQSGIDAAEIDFERYEDLGSEVLLDWADDAGIDGYNARVVYRDSRGAAFHDAYAVRMRELLAEDSDN